MLIDYARGRREVPVRNVFCRMNVWLKAIGLELLISLKTALWMLPGMALSIIAGAFGSHEILIIAVLAGWMLMFALAIPAAIRYSLARCFLAEDTSRGVVRCINLSVMTTEGRKWQLFKLGVPYVLKMLGVMLAVMVAVTLLLLALGQMETALGEAVVSAMPYLGLALSMGFLAQDNLATALFYEKLTAVPTADAAPAAPAEKAAQ